MENMEIKDFYKNKKVLITGHTGFKGSWMVKVLTMWGADVTGYALEPPTNPSLFDLLNLKDLINNHVGDVRDYEHMKKVFDSVKPEIVIHMAAQPIVRKSYTEPKETYEINVLGTVNLMECVRLTESVKSVINVTTDKVYLNREWEWGYRENEELNGFDPYSNSKSCSELVTSSYKSSFFSERSCAVSTCRAGNVIGGGDFAQDRIIPDCIRAVMEKKDIIVRNPYSTRPYQHVLEPVMAYLLLAKSQWENKGLEGAYNIGPDDRGCVTTGNLVDLFCNAWKEKTGNSIKWINMHDGGLHEASYLKLDCSKIKNVLGWLPVWTLDRTMSSIVEWYDAWIGDAGVSECIEGQIEDYMHLYREAMKSDSGQLK